jgi:amino acid transporter
MPRRRIGGTSDAIAVSASDDGEGREVIVAVSVTPPRRHRFSLPEDRGQRMATLSLLMVAATVVAAVVAGIVGTFLGFVVFDLGEQELLTAAGVWGYVAAVLLLALMVLPAVTGIALGVRARRLGEQRRGTTGIIVNAVVAAYLVFTVAATLLFG